METPDATQDAGLQSEEPSRPVDDHVEPPESGWIGDGTRRSLHPAAVVVSRISSWIGTAVLFLLAAGSIGAMLLFTDLPRWIELLVAGAAVGLVAVSAIASQFWPPVACRHVSYRVSDAGVEIRRGVLWRHVQVVPRSRVQHTDVSTGPVQRRYGLATLTLHTAGTMNHSVELSGIGRETATAIRDFLRASGGDDAV